MQYKTIMFSIKSCKSKENYILNLENIFALMFFSIYLFKLFSIIIVIIRYIIIIF